MATSETDQLAALIHQKRACLLRLHQMGRRQLELIGDDRMAELLDVLAAKQSFLAELEQIERALDPFRSEAPDSRPWPTSDKRRKCGEELAECEALLAEIVAQEKQAETELIRRRDDTAICLQGTHAAGRARSAYTTEKQPGISQLDLSSEG